MSGTPSDPPHPFRSWPAAVGRSLHPVRLVVCTLALALSLALGECFLWLFERPPAAGWQDPVVELQRLRDSLVGSGSGTLLFRGALLAIPLAFVWSVAGVWITQAELFRKHQLPSRTAGWVLGRAAQVSRAFLAAWMFLGFTLLPGLLAGVIQRLPVLGPVTVVILLPVLLAFALLAVVIVVGLPSYAIMPASSVAEGSDMFDVLARSYSYICQVPFRFSGWCALSLAASALPLVAMAGLLRDRVDPAGPSRNWLLTAAAVPALSIFWTLQSHVYLKLRRVVDNTPEDELADLAGTGKAPSTEVPSPAPAKDSGADRAEQPASETAPSRSTPPPPGRTAITLSQTIDGGPALGLSRLVFLLVGMLWASLVMAAGVFAAHLVSGLPPPPLTATGLRRAIEAVWTRGPATAVEIGLGMILLGAVGLARPLRAVARSAAVQTAFEVRLPWRTAWSSARRLGWRGTGSVVLLSAGIEAFLLTFFLLGLGRLEGEFAAAIPILGGVSVALLLVGAVGLGAVAVEGMSDAGMSDGALATYARNGPETLASALAAVVGGACRFVSVAGLAGLAWLLLCDSLSWWGGDQAHWVRWGLDGRLVPGSEPGVQRVASALGGCWFVFVVGLVLAYPISYLLGWGVNAYLRGRQQSQETPPGHMDLSPDEETAVRAAGEKAGERRAGVKKKLADLKARRAQPSPESPVFSEDASRRETDRGERPPDPAPTDRSGLGPLEGH